MTTAAHRDRVAADSAVEVVTIPSPVGALSVGASDVGIRFVMWDRDPRPVPDGTTDDHRGTARRHILERARVQLDEYFRGERTEFDLPLDPQGTPFQQAAWAALRTIPYGETVSYGHQARLLGDVRKSRAVGAANGKNPIGIVVPCHRVVGSNGSLTGFAGGLSAKAWLLDHERTVATGAGRLF
ncbi:MAG: methylated-DNA--[protein]-cysteine S-methyltransferase [Actinomycetota bacterium]|jgi:methylated-DNA-[protein]-cysteine S-methyltransferase|nr:MAG: ogt [Acidimicrobiaceae bacterium]